jgi:hypothetical protein
MQRIEAIQHILSYIPILERNAVLQEVLESATALEDERGRVKKMASLAAYLEPAHRGQTLREVLEFARSIGDEQVRAEALTGLVPHLSDTLLAEALVATRAIGDKRFRAEVLIELAPRLPEPERTIGLQEALDLITGNWEERQATASEGPTTRKTAGSSLLFFPWSSGLPWRHESVRPELGEAQRALWEDEIRGSMLAKVAGHLTDTLLGLASEAARSIRSRDGRAKALAGLAPHLPEPVRTKALREALEAVQAMWDQQHRAEALAGLVPYLPEPLLAEVLEAARATRDEGHRSRRSSSFRFVG